MEQISVNLTPSRVKETCHASQYDVGRRIRLALLNGRSVYTLSGTETVTLVVRKPDGTEWTETLANTSSTYVDLITNRGNCDQSGTCKCEIRVVDNGVDVGSGNFDMKVEADTVDGMVEEKTASGAIAAFEAGVPALFESVKCEINAKQDLHGEDKPYPAGGGVNLFDGAWFNDGAWNNSTNLIKVSEGASYYAYTPNIPNNERLFAYYYDENKNRISDTKNLLGRNAVFTIPSGVAYIRLILWNTFDYTNLSINYPSSDHDYHPYENICPITGYTEANITRCGVNLFDKSFEINHRWEGNGTYSSEVGARNAGCPDKIPCKPSTTYCFVFPNYAQTTFMYLSEFDANKANIQKSSGKSINSTTHTVTFTTGANTFYMSFSLYANTDFTSAEISEIGVNYPATDTSYHAYKGQTYTVSFGQTVYGGVLDVTRGKLHVTWAVNLISNMSWSYDSVNTRFSSPSLSSVMKAPTGIRNTELLCPIYNCLWHGESITPNVTDNVIYTSVGGGIYIHDLQYTSASDFVTARGNNPICYELATPFDIDLTPVQIEALLGINNVWHDDNGDTEVKYIDLKGEET